MFRQLLINGLAIGFNYGLVAVSFGLIYRTAGFFHFAHGAVYTAAAYFLLLLTTSLYVPVTIGIIIAVVGGACLGGLIDIFIYRPLRHRGSSSEVLLLASLGLMIVIQNLISLIFGDTLRRLRASTILEGFDVGGARITAIQLTTILVSASISLALWSWLKWARLGKYMRAVASDKELSRIVGINSEMVTTAAFMIGSAVTAVAAILNAYDTDLTPMMGFRAILMAVVASIIGGLGSIPGALFGGLLIGLTQSITAWWLPTQWQDALVFVVLIVFLLIRPHGFFGYTFRSEAV
jgi:branched-chain amino acid transport system permease protein